MNNRKIRLPEIVDILTRQFISSQEELSRQLAVRGHAVTQATLSRDLKLLKANKSRTSAAATVMWWAMCRAMCVRVSAPKAPLSLL